jgi:hypothetical protein
MKKQELNLSAVGVVSLIVGFLIVVGACFILPAIVWQVLVGLFVLIVGFGVIENSCEEMLDDKV